MMIVTWWNLWEAQQPQREKDRARREQEQARKRAKKEAKKEREREQREQDRHERELRQAEEMRRNHLPVDWRKELAKMWLGRHAAPVEPISKLQFDMRLACAAFAAWEACFPRRPPCPLVASWRDRAVRRFNDWSRREARRRGRNTHVEHVPYKEPTHIFTTKRRPSLTYFDNKRDSVISDRYRMGIYRIDYEDY